VAIHLEARRGAPGGTPAPRGPDEPHITRLHLRSERFGTCLLRTGHAIPVGPQHQHSASLEGHSREIAALCVMPDGRLPRAPTTKRSGCVTQHVWSGRAVQEVSSILAMRSCINVSGL
jgi:hypothetical protein